MSRSQKTTSSRSKTIKKIEFGIKKKIFHKNSSSLDGFTVILLKRNEYQSYVIFKKKQEEIIFPNSFSKVKPPRVGKGRNMVGVDRIQD